MAEVIFASNAKIGHTYHTKLNRVITILGHNKKSGKVMVKMIAPYNSCPIEFELAPNYLLTVLTKEQSRKIENNVDQEIIRKGKKAINDFDKTQSFMVTPNKKEVNDMAKNGLKKLRVSRGFTQVGLAKKAGIPRMVWSIETGHTSKKGLDHDIVKKLAEAFGMSKSSFLEETGLEVKEEKKEAVAA